MGVEEKQRWYVIQAYSGYEAKVVETIKEKLSRTELEKNVSQILIPSEEVVEVKDGKKTKTPRKFFPGYILIKMLMNNEMWHLIKAIPRVAGFIGGTSDRPAPITDREVNSIMQKMEEATEKPKPKTLYDIGEEVLIVDGPFAEFNGVVENVDYAKSRVKVSVLILGRSTPVELEFTQVKKA